MHYIVGVKRLRPSRGDLRRRREPIRQDKKISGASPGLSAPVDGQAAKRNAAGNCLYIKSGVRVPPPASTTVRIARPPPRSQQGR